MKLVRGWATAVAALLLLTLLTDSVVWAKGGSRGGSGRGGNRGGSGSSGGSRRGDTHRPNTPRPYTPAKPATPRPGTRDRDDAYKPSAPDHVPESSYPKQPAVNPGWNPSPPKPAQPAQPGWNPPPQPGWQQPGQPARPGQPAQPGWNPPPQPGGLQPGQPAQPGWNPPAQPGWQQPGQTQPGWKQPGQHQPGQPQPGLAQPGQPQPGWAQPGQPQPGWAQPGQPQPGWAQPGQNQPGWQQQGHYQPGWQQQGHYQPGWQQQGQYQPGWQQQGHYQPGWPQSGQHGWRPGQQQPGWGQPAYPGQQWSSSSHYPGQVSSGIGQNSFMTNSYHPSYFGNSGYKSKNKFFPSFGGGGFYGGNNGRVGSFGSSKLRYAPLLPLLFLVPFIMPHYSMSMFRSCACVSINKITVCPNKLSSGHVPSCVDDDSTGIFILSRKVEYLSGDAFRHTRHLEYINVTHTNVEALPRDLFRQTPKVKTLVVQGNRDLSTLDGDLFRGLDALESLFLDHNQLERVDSDLLRPLEALTTLNLGHNRLASLPAGLLERNVRLTELSLSGNNLRSLHEDLLQHCPRLRVLLLRDNALGSLPLGLFRNNENLEWLDLDRNNLMALPAALLKPCPRLGWLGVAHNQLETIEAPILLDHGGVLSAFQLAGNSWKCNCDLLPLAGWVVLRADAVDGAAPTCRTPSDVSGLEMRRWFHDRGALCETSPLQSRLQELLRLSLALAWDDPKAGLNASVSFVAASHFRYALAAESHVDPDLLVGRFVGLLSGVYGRKFPGVNISTVEEVIGNINSTRNTTLYSEASEVEKIKMKLMKAETVEEIETIFNETLGNRTKNITLKENGSSSNTVEATTTALTTMSSVESADSTVSSLQKLQQDILKAKSVNDLLDVAFMALRETKSNASFAKTHKDKLNATSLNFTFIFKDVPQNMTSEVDKCVIEELHLLFGVNTTSNVTSKATENTTLTSIAAETNLTETVNSTVNTNHMDTAVNSNTTLISNVDKASFTDTSNLTEQSSDNMNRENTLNSTIGQSSDKSSMDKITDGSNTFISDTIPDSSSNGSNFSVVNGSKIFPNNSPLTNHTVANSTHLLNGTNITAGLRSELQTVMMMLLTSVDRAKWDMENIMYNNVTIKKPRPPSSHFISRSTATRNKFTISIIFLHLLTTVIAYRVM